MKINLPQELKGIKFDRVTPIDMNPFTVEMVLPALFHMLRTQGRRIGKPNDVRHFHEYVGRLLASGNTRGFDSEPRRKLLCRWLRTSVVSMGRRGRRHGEEQIQFLYPLSFLTYKAGWPDVLSRSWLRGVHWFIYHALRAETSGKEEELFSYAFERGLILEPGPNFDGRYDGRTELDVETLLCLRFLDVLKPTGVGHDRSDPPNPYLAPDRAAAMARHIRVLIQTYGGRVPTSLLTTMLMALINFHLFVYTLRLVHEVQRIICGEGDPPKTEALEIYCDCPGDAESYSDLLARRCVERDLESLERYARSLILLRTLDRYAAAPELRARLEDPGRNLSAYLQDLVRISKEPLVKAQALNEWLRIRQANQEEESGRGENEAALYIEELEKNVEALAVERTVQVLYDAQRKSALQNLTGWFKSVGGLNRPYGVLSGNERARRRILRYSLSNLLLTTLVHLALADRPAGGPVGRMRLDDFIRWLSENFGLLVSRPPSFDRSIEAVRATADNFAALKRRLRQAGALQDLSDAQRALFIRLPMPPLTAAAASGSAHA